MKTLCLVWFLSILAILVPDVRTGASQEKDVAPLRCYICARVNSSMDCQVTDDLLQEKCTPESPFCGTIAKSPDYMSALACTRGGQLPCTLIQTAKDEYEMTCSCEVHLCNKPFTREFREELLNFSPTNFLENSPKGLIDMFINSSTFSNIDLLEFYEAITFQMIQETLNVTNFPPKSIALNTVLPIAFNKQDFPRAEALKHEATAPSDDDEDESEGSGSFENVKSQAPAAPAAPSSFLPANENTAIAAHINLLAAIPFISLYTLA